MDSQQQLVPHQTTPHIDPSALTTQMVLREVEILHNLIDDKEDNSHREQDALQKLLEAKEREANKISDEKFHSIETQFSLIERQRVEQKSDTKAAVDAALIAQKEAVQEQTIASGLSIAKSETATAKQLDQLSVTLTTAISGVTLSANELKDNINVSIIDIKDRITRIESTKVGATEQRTNTRESINTVQVALGIGLILLTIFTTLTASGIFK